MAHLRYQIRKNPDDRYWSVIDIFTGQPVMIKGVPLDVLLLEEADEMVDLLNIKDMKGRGVFKHP
jgi:hypothetical protein